MNGNAKQTLTGGAVAAIGLAVAVIALADIYQDWSVRDVSVSLTLIAPARTADAGRSVPRSGVGGAVTGPG